MGYDTQHQVLDALRNAPKGRARSEILYQGNNRSLVLTTGANLVIYSGTIMQGQSIEEKLSGINVAVLKRMNPKTSQPNGLGTLGGLAERTNPFEFHIMSMAEKAKLLGEKDDVIMVEGTPTLTKDIQAICRNNFLREAKEELADLGITDISLDNGKFEAVPLQGLRDDNYLINIWDGQGVSYAVNPHCHIMQTDESLIDSLAARSQNSGYKNGSEALAIEKRPLFDLLPRFGQKGDDCGSEDGRDMQNDYRYPHEWLMTWVIASKALNHNPREMIKLAQEIGKKAKHPVNFLNASHKMSVTSTTLAEAMGVDINTFYQMQTQLNQHNIINKCCGNSK